MTCSVDGCTAQVSARSFCSAHYARMRKGHDLARPIQGRQDRGCRISECERNHYAKGMCKQHYHRRWSGRDSDYPIGEVPRSSSTWSTNVHGYRVRSVFKNGKRTYESEHRVQMEQMLGRPLIKGENVHHRNGNRSDNRPSNLELWITTQPQGQRVEDKLKWAHEIIDMYETTNRIGEQYE